MELNSISSIVNFKLDQQQVLSTKANKAASETLETIMVVIPSNNPNGNVDIKA